MGQVLKNKLKKADDFKLILRLIKSLLYLVRSDLRFLSEDMGISESLYNSFSKQTKGILWL